MHRVTMEEVRLKLNTRQSWPAWAVGLSLLQALAVGACEGVVVARILGFLLATFSQTTSGYSPFIGVYFGLFIFSLVFQLAIALDAYFHRNSIEVIAVVVFNFTTVIYSIVQIFQVSNLRSCILDYADIFQRYVSNTDSVSGGPESLYPQVYTLEHNTARICPFLSVVNNSDGSFSAVSSTYPPEVIASNIIDEISKYNAAFGICYAIVAIMVICNLVGAFLSYKTFGVYGWSIYQIQGADIVKRQILRRYHIFITLMKFNLFFALGIFSQVAVAIYFKSKVTIVTSGDTTGTLHEDLAIQRTSLWIYGTIVAVVTIVYLVLGYFGMRHANKILMSLCLMMMLVYMAAVSYIVYLAHTDPNYAVTKIWLTIFVFCQICLNLATLTSSIFSMADFSKGLADLIKSTTALPSLKRTQSEKKEDAMRMIID